MIQYKAGYKYTDHGVHAQVLDYPAAISDGLSIDDARVNLLGALVDMAQTAILHGDRLPKPDPLTTDDEMDLEEPIYLHLHASNAFQEEPRGVMVP
jgi:hypothetical protein